MSPADLIHKAFCENDASLFRRTVAEHPELKDRINDTVGPFDSPLIVHVRSREMLDAVLEAGADINAKSRWWAGGFCLLDSAPDDLAAYAIERGAVVEAHAAARLGMMERLRELITRDPRWVHARGGDGQTPLHFARNVEVAELLVAHGANMDARDVDHESTPAQYMIDDRQDVVRFLIKRGCTTDIFMAAALGDTDLALREIEANPGCVAWRVDEESFPMTNRRAGGTIYQWKLGFHVSPHEVARKFGHEETFQLLMERSPREIQFIQSCWLGDDARVKAILAENSDIVERLSPREERQLAHAARNNQWPAARLMLEAGMPLDVRGQHSATPLHWAAWHGNAEMVAALLKHGAPLEVRDADHGGTPLDWAIHGSENGWYCDKGDYSAVVNSLLKAGAKIPERKDGTEAVRTAIAKHLSTSQQQ